MKAGQIPRKIIIVALSLLALTALEGARRKGGLERPSRGFRTSLETAGRSDFTYPDIIYRRSHKTGSSAMNLWLRANLPCEYHIIAMNGASGEEVRHARQQLGKSFDGPIAFVAHNDIVRSDLLSRGRRVIIMDTARDPIERAASAEKQVQKLRDGNVTVTTELLVRWERDGRKYRFPPYGIVSPDNEIDIMILDKTECLGIEKLSATVGFSPSTWKSKVNVRSEVQVMIHVDPMSGEVQRIYHDFYQLFEKGTNNSAKFPLADLFREEEECKRNAKALLRVKDDVNGYGHGKDAISMREEKCSGK